MYNPTKSSTYFIKDLKSYWHVEEEYETGFSNYLLRALNEQLLMFVNILPSVASIPQKLQFTLEEHFCLITILRRKI